MGRPKIDRTGEQNYNHQGELMTIIKCIDAFNIDIKFEETGAVKYAQQYSNFKIGNIKDNFYPDIYDVGCLGNATSRDSNRKKKKAYLTWHNMLMRCYDEKSFKKHPTYVDCSVCDEWLCYENFEKWFSENYYEIDNEQMELDKDILVKGNKTYSPATCVFVPKRINMLIVKADGRRGKHPLGVTFDKETNKFMGRVITLDKIQKKRFNTKEEAFMFYKTNKEHAIKQVADEYKDKIPQRLYDALYAYEVEITD